MRVRHYGETDMDTTTDERIEQLEGLVRTLIGEIRDFRAEFRTYVERQDAHNRQTAVLLKGISTRLETVEHRVGAVEDRVTALEGAAGPQC